MLNWIITQTFNLIVNGRIEVLFTWRFQMFEKIEKWALQRLLKRVAKNLPLAQEELTKLWKQHKEEIFEKIVDVIQTTLKDILVKPKKTK